MRGPPNLPSLPAELLHLVFAHLSRADHKSLRRTCRSLCQIATGYVFFRAHISILKTDRDAFFQISRHSHLCCLVEQVVWYDLPSLKCDEELEKIFSNRQGNHHWGVGELTDLELPGERDLQLIGTVQRLASSYRRAIWLDVNYSLRQPSFADIVVRGHQLSLFFKEFVAALERMPLLRTLISRPAQLEKIISEEGDTLAFDTGLFLQFHTSRREAGIRVLLQALTVSSNLKIKELHVADNPSTSTLYKFDLSHSEGADWFSRLEVIDLCISNVRTDALDDFRGLAICLHQAKELRRMKLCFENLKCQHGGILYFKACVFDMLIYGTTWKDLESIDFMDLMFFYDTFNDFLDRHSETLQHIILRECELQDSCWCAMVKSFMLRPVPRLQSIYMSQPDTDERLFPPWLLKMIRGKNDRKDIENLRHDDFQWSFDRYEDLFVYEGREQIRIHGNSAFDHSNYDDRSDGASVGDSDHDSDDDNPVAQQPLKYWILNQLDENRIVFYSTPSPVQEEYCYPTQTWLFKRHDGNYAYSSPEEPHPDPFEYFEEWDDDKDVVEQTPYGDAFVDFYENLLPYHEDWIREYPSDARVWIDGFDSEPLSETLRKQLRS